MSDERSTRSGSDQEAAGEPVLGAHEPAPPTEGTTIEPVSSAPALQRRDAAGETS